MAEQLREPLELQASRPPRDHEYRVFNPRDSAQRAAAAAIAAHVGQPQHLTLLAALSKDEDTSVRAAVAKGLAIWAGRTGAPPAVSELLDQVLSEPGVRLGLAVSETLTDDQSHANLEPLLRRLSRHPSAVVRWRANHTLSRMSH